MMKRIRFDDYEPGAEIPELAFGPLSQMDLVRYAGASGDFNPIHNDLEFARSVGLPGTIAHGMLIMAQLGRLCSDWANPLQFRSLVVKFKDMTSLGQTITCSGVVKKKMEEGGEKRLLVTVEARGDDDKIKVAGELAIAAD